MADTSLWPVVVGGLGVGGTMVGVIGTTIRDVAQQRHEKAKRRADKFEELVVAVYEFDHWLSSMHDNVDAFGNDKVRQPVSPFAKMQSISFVYFPQFVESIALLDQATFQYKIGIYNVGQKRISNPGAPGGPEYVEAATPYMRELVALLDALKEFAHDEFQ